MSAPLTPSEQFTHDICTNSFLSLWCYNNPKGKKGKELCDVLVVCEPDIILFSVKDIAFDDPNNQIQADRWQRNAIDASIKQLYGAAKWISGATHIIHADGSQGIALPAVDIRRIHRVAVAFGSRGECSIRSGDFGKGHVHVLTEITLVEVLTELDTITDFVHYLSTKEQFLSRGAGIVINGTESDLLGLYIHGGRTFPNEPDFMILDQGIWEEIQSKPEFRARKTADRDSYMWDELIEELAAEEGHVNSESGLSFTDRELVVRGMARENRFFRRMLANSLTEFIRAAKAGKTRSRIVRSMSGGLYVFTYFRLGEARRPRNCELIGRCLVARNKVEDANNVVIGIGFCEYNPELDSSETDLLYLEINDQNDEWRTEAQQIEEELGYFKGQPTQHFEADEFPNADAE